MGGPFSDLFVGLEGTFGRRGLQTPVHPHALLLICPCRDGISQHREHETRRPIPQQRGLGCPKCPCPGLLLPHDFLLVLAAGIAGLRANFVREG